MGIYTLTRTQQIPTEVEKIWDFISAPQNLKDITPPYMGFEITSSNLPEKMYQGMMIHYKVSPILGIKLTWVTEISQVRELEYFVDEQRHGPYSLWHHQHLLKPNADGVLMEDIVTYRPPMGFLGSIANALFIRKQLENIFDFRYKKIEQCFGANR